MRKDRFFDSFAEHASYLRNIAMKAGLDYDNASEVVGKCADNLLESKKYTTVDSDKIKAFLHAAVRFEIKHYQHASIRHTIDCARLPDPELTYTADSKVKVNNSIPIGPVEGCECPFCFKANLNEYGACSMCHTILPSQRKFNRNVLTVTEESLAVEFDFNTKIDVHNAIARLTPFEQRVVKAIGLGNESLESFALDLNVSKTSLVRTWVEAKAKLQVYLEEYANDGLSRRGENAFRKALKGIENQQVS